MTPEDPKEDTALDAEAKAFLHRLVAPLDALLAQRRGSTEPAVYLADTEDQRGTLTQAAANARLRAAMLGTPQGELVTIVGRAGVSLELEVLVSQADDGHYAVSLRGLVDPVSVYWFDREYELDEHGTPAVRYDRLLYALVKADVGPYDLQVKS